MKGLQEKGKVGITLLFEQYRGDIFLSVLGKHGFQNLYMLKKRRVKIKIDVIRTVTM